MEQVKISRNIDGKVVEIAGIPDSLKEKVEAAVDAKIQRATPLSKIESDFKALNFTVTVTGDVENYTEPVLVTTPVVTEPVKGKRGRKVDTEKRDKIGNIIREMRTDGKRQKDIIERLTKEFGMAYANGFYYCTKVFPEG